MSRYPGIQVLQAASFTSSFDRVMIAPLLVTISVQFGLSVAAVTVVATVHLLSYGAMQVIWALLSDRYGRVRIMRLALLAAALGCLGAAASDSLGALVAARAVAGGAFAAVIPGAMVYIGDSVPVHERQGPLTDLMRGTAVGAATATVVTGFIADLTSWRIPFLVVGAGALLLAAGLTRLSEPPTTGAPRSPGGALLAVLRSGWALLVLALALGEGFVLLAILNFVPAALQSTDGMSATAAGAVVALYGVGALLMAPVVKRLSAKVPRRRLIALGAPVVILSLFAFPLGHGAAPLLIGCGLLGCGWAFVHSSLQTWATDVVPKARAAAVSLFATVLFLGNAVGTFAGGQLLAVTDFRTVFLTFALLGVPVMLTAWWGSRRYGA